MPIGYIRLIEDDKEPLKVEKKYINFLTLERKCKIKEAEEEEMRRMDKKVAKFAKNFKKKKVVPKV
jgi:hypothetical protein